MPIATGVNKKLAYRKETGGWGVKAPNDSTAKYLRRLQSNLNLAKATYRSNEIRPDYQRADFRHGTRSVEGNVQAELSVGTWFPFVASAMRRDMAAGASSTGEFGYSSTNGEYTRAIGSFLTDGHKVGDVVRAVGFTASALNDHNFLVTGVTATALTGVFVDGAAPATEAAATGKSITISQPGKGTYVPKTGHTDDSYSIEHWQSDIAVSEVYTGCKVSQIDVNLPATGLAEIDVQFMGKDMEKATTQHFGSAAAASSGSALAAVNGVLYINGTKYGTVTGINFSINGNYTAGEVVGSTTTPDIFEGSVDVSGQLTCYFENDTLLNMFLNETEASVSVVLTAENTKDAGFVAFTMPRIKVGGNSKDDGEKGLVQTVPFTALMHAASGEAKRDTTIQFQDSGA